MIAATGQPTFLPPVCSSLTMSHEPSLTNLTHHDQPLVNHYNQLFVHHYLTIINHCPSIIAYHPCLFIILNDSMVNTND